MPKKHKVTIWCADRDAPDWQVKCSCGVKMEGFGGPGMAEQAIERYHNAKNTSITSIKVKR